MIDAMTYEIRASPACIILLAAIPRPRSEKRLNSSLAIVAHSAQILLSGSLTISRNSLEKSKGQSDPTAGLFQSLLRMLAESESKSRVSNAMLHFRTSCSRVQRLHERISTAAMGSMRSSYLVVSLKHHPVESGEGQEMKRRQNSEVRLSLDT